MVFTPSDDEKTLVHAVNERSNAESRSSTEARNPIHAITDSYQNQVLPPVNELFQKELRMDMNNMDITSRVTSYFMSCNTLIKKYGFTSFFEEEHGSK
ncbi:hypothetical protein PF007_g21663 [Phytophthora fragariae]|uniref:Uncharacterized protein n=1 Tax=Phytophthora fragariae TaxID=53985 RepID=A0A6A3QVE7_9STRA|nr:hypothetical protein PF007_g21663 [Phytophthora fragariae]